MASKLVLIIVFVFNLIAFGLAVAAERRKNTAIIGEDPDMYYVYCVYDSDIATGFGVGAFFLLMASQVLLMVASRCFCCGKSLNPNGSRACAVILFIICWLTFIIAELFLMGGSIKNTYHTNTKIPIEQDLPPYCETLREGVFAAAAAFIILTTIFSEFYYVSYSKARSTYQAYGGGGEAGVGMGTYKGSTYHQQTQCFIPSDHHMDPFTSISSHC